VLLMALTIISTVGTVVSALAALGIFPRCEAKPPTVVIVVNDVKPGMIEPDWRALAELAAREPGRAGRAGPLWKGTASRTVPRPGLTREAKQWTATSGGLEPVARGQASMLAGAFVSRARCVMGEHCSRLPSGEAHQVTLGTAVGEPVMRERVPELMGVKIGKPYLDPSVLDRLIDAARREPTLLAKPQPRIGRVRMCGTGADVSVNVTGSFGPDGEHHLTATLGHDPRHSRAQVYVRRVGIVGAVPQSAHALESHAGIEEQPDDRSVATITEVLARARSKQAPDLVVR
jgi:hypothetical protein